MIQPFLFCDEGVAAELGAFIGGDGGRIEPRLVTGGDHSGKYAIPVRVWSDPDFRDLAGKFAAMEMAAIDIGEAWPPEP